MEEQLVSFETANLAKEKGFVDMAIPQIYIGKGVLWDYSVHGSCSNYNYVEAPTQSLLQKWLREEHSIHICVEYRGMYFGDVWIVSKGTKHFRGFSTYEEALEEALKIGLNRIEE